VGGHIPMGWPGAGARRPHWPHLGRRRGHLGQSAGLGGP
jgi:hypothetical protein